MLAIILLFPGISAADTYFLGFKTWFTTWDSSVLDWFEKDLAAGFIENGLVLDASKGDGTGYLAGPVLGYQKEGSPWSFSSAFMIFSDFSQDWEGTASSMDIESDLALDRIDVDLAGNYQLSDNFKLFVGYKHQHTKIDFGLTYDTMMGTRDFDYTLEADAKMPTAGVAGVTQLGEKVMLSAQFGLLYSIMDLTLTDDAGTSFEIWPRPSLGFNSEIDLNYHVTEEIVIQAGYRYQIFQLEARSPERWEIVTVSNDITEGFVMSIVWVL